MVLLQGWHPIALSVNQCVVYKLACLLIQVSACRDESSEFESVENSSDYFARCSNLNSQTI